MQNQKEEAVRLAVSAPLAQFDSPDNRSYGALVGWKSDDLHDKIVLRMQIVSKPPPHAPDDIHHSVVVMNKNQAVQLGNYLFQAAGLAKLKKRRTWFRRFFGV